MSRPVAASQTRTIPSSWPVAIRSPEGDHAADCIRPAGARLILEQPPAGLAHRRHGGHSRPASRRASHPARRRAAGSKLPGSAILRSVRPVVASRIRITPKSATAMRRPSKDRATLPYPMSSSSNRSSRRRPVSMSQDRTSEMLTFSGPYGILVCAIGIVLCPADRIRRPSGVTATNRGLTIDPLPAGAVRPGDPPQQLPVRQAPDADRLLLGGSRDQPRAVGRERQAEDARVAIEEVPFGGVLHGGIGLSRRIPWRRRPASRPVARGSGRRHRRWRAGRPSGENATALTVRSWSLVRGEQPGAGHVPQRDVTLPFAPGQLRAVGREGHAPDEDAVRIRRGEPPDLPARPHVEERDLRGGVGALRGGDQPAVGREGDVRDRIARPQVVRADLDEGARGQGGSIGVLGEQPAGRESHRRARR